MISKLLKVRWIFYLTVIVLLLNTVVFIIVGVVNCVDGYIDFIKIGFMPHDGERPGIKLVEGLDAFMVAIVFMIFALGIGSLLLDDKSKNTLPSWMQFHDFKSLKIVLWEALLVTLVVFCATSIIKDAEMSWKTLILPGTILILSAALYLVRGKEHN